MTNNENFFQSSRMQSARKSLLGVTGLVAGMAVVLGACSGPNAKVSLDRRSSLQSAAGPVTTPLIRSDFKSGEVTALCENEIATVRRQLDAIAALPPKQRTTDNTLLALEQVTADLGDVTTPLAFMGSVSTDPAIHAEGSKCETEVGQFSVEIMTRRDLYNAVVKAVPRNPDEARLLFKTLEEFEQNGLKLSDENLAKVRDLKNQLTVKETQFSTNLNNDVSSILLDASELDGLPADYRAGLKKDPSGKFIVNTKESDYPIVIENATNPETRKKMMSAYLSRQGEKNSQLLIEAVQLRAKIAHLLGFKTWADYRTETRMAKNGATVLKFLNGLRSKLEKRNRDDMAKILKFKQKTLLAAKKPTSKTLDQWDIPYYSYQLQKTEFNLDNEKIREYFPADVVITGLFKIYSEMLGVQFKEIKDAKVWASDVHLFAIYDASGAATSDGTAKAPNSAADKEPVSEGNGRLIGYFYTDFFPRPGKYDHAAAFSLISGRTLSNGAYSQPISAIVANLNPPVNGKPSLLAHEDVETIFHEFGHIMHQTLTRAPYASLSGSSVAQDFVEAPSQMLENWVWSPKIVNALSGHYLDHGKKLPPDILKKLIAARDFNQGYSYTKQLLYSLFDMTLHTQDGPVDANQVYLDLYRQIMGMDPLASQKFAAGFGHLMGGYDAGYYGYLWSEVYAQDMFTRFPKNNLASAEVGRRYRKDILEPGNMKDALDLLRNFLGREPNSDAFFKKLHIGK